VALRSKLLAGALVCTLAALSVGISALGAAPPPERVEEIRCPICGGSFEEFQAKYLFIVRQSTRLIVHLLN